MAENYVSYEMAVKLQHVGLYFIQAGITVTGLRNALEGMEAKTTSNCTAWDEFRWWYAHYKDTAKYRTVMHDFTDAEAMAAAVIEYMKWRESNG